MRKNHFLWIVTIAVIFLLGLLIYFVSNQKTSFVISGPIASNIQYPEAVSEKVYFFTGSNFAFYDTKQGTTNTLSPIYNLPNVTDVKWLSKAVMFEADNYSPVDDLYQILSTKKLPGDRSYWWLLNFDTKQLQLIEDPVSFRPASHVAWDHSSDRSIFYFSTGRLVDDIYSAEIFKQPLEGTPEKIFSYRGDLLEDLVSARSSELFFEAKKDNTYRLIKIEPSSKKITEILKDIIPGTTFSGDGNSLTFYRSSKQKSETDFGIRLNDFFYMDLGKKEESLIARKFSGNTAWSQLAKSFSSTGSNEKQEPQHFLLKGGVVKNLKEEQLMLLTNLFIYSDQNNLRGYGVTEAGELVRISYKQEKLTGKKTDDSALRSDFYEDGFNINYIPKLNTYNVYITQNPYSTTQQKAIKFFQDKGVDTNQIKIKWYAYDRVDKSK